MVEATPTGADAKLIEIGRISVLFGTLELVTAFLLFRLLDHGGRPRGMRLFGGDPIDQQLMRIERLLPSEDDEELALDVLEWIRDVRKAKDERNHILHATWLFTEEEPDYNMTLIMRRGESRLNEYTVEDLKAIAARIKSLIGRTNGLLSRYTDADKYSPPAGVT